MFGKRKKVDETKVADLVSMLGGVAFFDGFSPDELHRVAELAEEMSADEGALLIDQGRVGQECYVIAEGEAGVLAGDELIATIGPGSIVGESALIEQRPRNASVVATTPMQLIVFDTAAFKTLLSEMPKAHDKVMETLAERMRARGET